MTPEQKAEDWASGWEFDPVPTREEVAKRAYLAGYHQAIEDADDLMFYWTEFRKELRQILYENGVASNPCWGEKDILDALRKLLKKGEK